MKREDYQLIVDTSTKEKISIERCIQFQNRDKERKTIVAFSGGKDSLVNYMIAVKSGIEFIPIYSPTSVDPPELIYYLRDFNKWAKEKGYPEVIFQKYNTFTKKQCGGKMEGREKTMWTLIGNRSMPPTRLARYCCDELKERTGETGDTVFTGVRWEESKKRATQKMVNFWKGKIMVRPIVDWTEVEVWSYILENKIPYCKLYDQGFDRLGCIGCPLSSNQKRELELYPAYKENYLRAFKKMLEYRKEHDKEKSWTTPEEVLKWWLGECEKKREEIDGQCSFF